MNRSLLTFLYFAFASLVHAEEPAMEALVKTTPLIVVAEPIFESPLSGIGESSEMVLAKYSLKFRIKTVLKAGAGIKSGDVILTRLALYLDDPFKPKEEEPVILFLQKTSYEENSFENTSLWFGVMKDTKWRELLLGSAIKEASSK